MRDKKNTNTNIMLKHMLWGKLIQIGDQRDIEKERKREKERKGERERYRDREISSCQFYFEAQSSMC